MTPTYYLHNGQLFEIDRIPPDMINRDWRSEGPTEQEYADFHTYLSTLQPIPNTFSGESRVVPPNQIEWVYEAKITFIESTWIETSEEKYNGLPDDQRRRVATPKITEAKPQTECASVNQGMECMCAKEGYDMTQCPHYKPLTTQPDIDNEKRNEVLSFIEAIRNSFKGSVKVYTLGSCYQFFKILKHVFPQAKAYYNSDHVITKIGGRYYDITGEVKPENHLEMDGHYPHSNVRGNVYDITETRK